MPLVIKKLLKRRQDKCFIPGKMSCKEENSNERISDHSDTNEHDDDDVNCSTNPQEVELINLDGDLQSLRADAIGDTMYSERFVLKILMQLGKITNDLEEEPQMEKDLCTLWDMTVEPDIIKYLLEYDVLEIFGELLNVTNDKRLTEILIGILANMCHLEEVRMKFYTKKLSVLTILLELTGCSDTLTLEQLMRLWSILFRKCPDENIGIWHKNTLNNTNLIENICFILNNVIATNVLKQTLDAILHIIIACDAMESNVVAETFVKQEVITATVEAFRTLVTKNDEWYNDDNDTNVRTLNWNFCNLHARLSDYKQISQEAYATCNADMLWCLRKVLQCLSQDNSSPATSATLKDWDNYEIEIIQSCYDILKVLPEPFDKHIVNYLISFWCMIKSHLGDGELTQDLFSLIMFCISASNKTANSKNNNKTNELLNELFDLLNDTDKHALLSYLEQRQQAAGDNSFLQCHDIIKKSY